MVMFDVDNYNLNIKFLILHINFTNNILNYKFSLQKFWADYDILSLKVIATNQVYLFTIAYICL